MQRVGQVRMIAESIVGDIELGLGREEAQEQRVVVLEPLDNSCVNAMLIGYIVFVNTMFLVLNIWQVSNVLNYRSHKF